MNYLRQALPRIVPTIYAYLCYASYAAKVDSAIAIHFAITSQQLQPGGAVPLLFVCAINQPLPNVLPERHRLGTAGRALSFRFA